jgi:hypothetical protein
VIVGAGGIVADGVHVVFCSVRAVFRDDPDGFRGHGRTEAEAEATLRRYASA